MFRMFCFLYTRYRPFTLRYPWIKFSQLWRFLKDLWQWVTKGYPDCFTWNIEMTVALFALPLVKRLRELDFGVPCCLRDDGESLEGTQKKWSKILDKIIYAFDSLLIDGELKVYEETLHQGKSVTEACKAGREESKKIQEGCELFGKYFTNLWW